MHCCHRVGAVREHGAVSFVELPGREAHWSPIPARHGEGIAAWTPSWSSMRRGRQLPQDAISLPPEAGSACPGCGRTRHWHYDANTGVGTLECFCPAVAPPSSAAAEDLRAAAWAHRRPPSELVTTDRNSWLYVPLLHAAAGNLAAPALVAWQASAPAAGWWDQARQVLHDAGPIPSQALLDLFGSSGAHPLADRLRLALRPLPQGTQLHLGWVLRLFSTADGYIPPACEEACLQLYGGYRLASDLDTMSNRFRAAPAAIPSAPTPAPPTTAPPPATITIPDDSDSDTDDSDTDLAPLSFNVEEPPVPPIVGAEPPSAHVPSAHTGFSAAIWARLDLVSLTEEFSHPVATTQAIPRCARAGLLHAFVLPLRVLAQPRATALQTERAWKLFLLVPRMLLRRTASSGAAGRAEYQRRLAAFNAGEWPALLAEARAAQRPPPNMDAPSREAVRARACAQVQRGELSRARQTLTSSALAPGNAATLQALTDPARRPLRPHRPFPTDLLSFQPPCPLHLTTAQVATALRTSKKGSAAGLSGATADHYKLFLEDEEALALFSHSANLLANASVPPAVLSALSLSRRTALQKPSGGVRGIATGDVMRRIVSRALARDHATVFDTATRPFQYALQCRAGTDCLASLLRAATDLDETATIVSLDGRSAYDSVSRAAFVEKLREVAPSLVPFACAFYGHESTFLWWDADGVCHEIRQADGCDQGDALAPAYFSLAQHGALQAAADMLEPGEFLAAYLDDVYLVTRPERARTVLDATTHAIAEHAGVAANLGKTRVYHRRGGPPPEGVAALGGEVWRGDKPPEERGLLALGVPIGDPAYVVAAGTVRAEDQDAFLQELVQLPDLQSAWLLLVYCAAPRAQHFLRTVPPSLSAGYAARHDAATWHTVQRFLGEPDQDTPQWQHARALAFLPAQQGGLGLLHASRVAPAAYWAAWADALPLLHQRCPEVAARCIAELAHGDSAAHSLAEASAAAAHLQAQGWRDCPAWPRLLAEGPPPPPIEAEPATWHHGWQRSAALVLHQSYRAQLLSTIVPSSQAMLRSQSGPHSSAWLFAIPAETGTALPPIHFHLALRRRLRLPLPLAHARCGAGGFPGCGRALDPLGDHGASCARSGALARRAHVLEHAWVRVAREAVGPEGRVVPQQWLSRTNAPGVPSDDRRRLDLVIHGATPLGEALCCDATLVSPLTSAGAPAHGAARRDGAALVVAERRKRQRYPELAASGPQRLLTLATETGGRWGSDCCALMRALVSTRSRRAPPALRSAASAGWQRRWWGLLSVAVQRAVCATILGGAWLQPPLPAGATEVPLAEVLSFTLAAPPSLMPTRG